MDLLGWLLHWIGKKRRRDTRGCVTLSTMAIAGLGLSLASCNLTLSELVAGLTLSTTKANNLSLSESTANVTLSTSSPSLTLSTEACND
jgi:hypothetical protein